MGGGQSFGGLNYKGNGLIRGLTYFGSVLGSQPEGPLDRNRATSNPAEGIDISCVGNLRSTQKVLSVQGGGGQSLRQLNYICQRLNVL